jgi:hypothetical protein
MMDFSYHIDTFSYVSIIFLHYRYDFLPSSNISYVVLVVSYAIETISYCVMTHLLTSVKISDMVDNTYDYQIRFLTSHMYFLM